MNYKLFISFIITLIACNFVLGQNQVAQNAFSSVPIQGDSLIIEREDGQKIKVSWPYRKNIKTKVPWAQLLEDFQADFSKVVNDIPKFKFYSISYFQKQNLVVDEVTGKETYTVNENDGMDYVKSNICKLRGKNIKITIEFNDNKELLDPLLKAEIEAAITQIKHKFYISSIYPERHYYSVSDARIIPNPKPKIKFFIPLGARIGLLKNEPYMELRPGLGLMKDKRYYIALNWNIITQYDEFMDKTVVDSYVGLSSGNIGAGFGSEFAFLVKSGINNNENIFFRAGINYRTRSGIQMGFDYYLREPEADSSDQSLLFGFHVGFGF